MENIVKLPDRSIVDEKTGEVRKKTIHDYTGEELDMFAEHDPDYESDLWSEAEIEALNNPDNHDKSN